MQDFIPSTVAALQVSSSFITILTTDITVHAFRLLVSTRNKLTHRPSNPMAGQHYSPEPRTPTIYDNSSVATFDPHPSWSPEVQNAYQFRHWVHGVMSWSVHTGLTDYRKGPAVELVLAGTARGLVREIPLEQKPEVLWATSGTGTVTATARRPPGEQQVETGQPARAARLAAPVRHGAAAGWASVAHADSAFGR